MAKPSSYLPPDARSWFSEFQHRFDSSEEMPHRRAAFYRLFCVDEHNADMRAFWLRVAPRLRNPVDWDELIGALIYSTDDCFEDQHVPLYLAPPKVTLPRLRDPAQIQARKLARLLRELWLITPPRCQAFHSSMMQSRGSTIEALVIYYHFELEGLDINLVYRKHSIENTAASKRGWVQRRRAHDVLRHRCVDAARKLVNIGRSQDADWLIRLADGLAQLPEMHVEHGQQPELLSQKSSWGDWLRVAQSGLHGTRAEGMLRQSDWRTLVAVLFDVHIADERIGEALRQTTPVAIFQKNPT